MKKLDYNICIVHFAHSMAWWELAELIYYSLSELGFNVSIQHRKMESNCRNIIFWCFCSGARIYQKGSFEFNFCEYRTIIFR